MTINRKLAKKYSLLALTAFVISGCGYSGDVAVVTKAGTTLGGIASGGVALANAKVTLQSADGKTTPVGTTNANGKFANFTVPETTKYPVTLTVSSSDGKSDLKTIIPSNPGTGTQTANINPITQAITAQVIPAGKTLADVNVGTGSDGFAAQSKIAVQTIFGSAVTYEDFSTKIFNARTVSTPTAGGLADTLIDVVAKIDSSRRPEEILSSAADKDDPSVSGKLMDSPSFQVKLAGEMVAQGRSASDANKLIASEVSSTADTTALITNTKTFTSAFAEVTTSATSMLTGTDTEKQKTMEAVVGATVKVIANTVEKSGASSGTGLANVVTNSMAMVKNPIIQMSQENQSKPGLSLMLTATSEQVANLITNNGTDLTKSDANTTSLTTQVKNFGQIVSSAVSNSMNSGQDKQNLDDKQQQRVATNLAKGVADSMTLYMGDMAKDPATLSDVEKTALAANMAKAGNTATNMATTLDSALTAMASDSNAKKLDGQVLNSLAKALVNQTSETMQGYDLTVSGSAFSNSAVNTITNMATLVVGNAANMANDTASLTTDKKAALASAMAGQVLQEVKSEDLSGSSPSARATNISNNLAKTVGPALVENVASTSSRKGSNLEVLAMGAAAQATAKVKEEMSLGEVVTNVVLETAKTKSKEAAEKSTTTLETAFQAMESAGVTLGNVTKGMSDNHVNGDAVNTVVSQVTTVLVNSGSLKNSAQEIASTASSMANAVLSKGGTLAQVKEAVAAPLAAMTDVATTTSSLSTEAGQDAIKNSINALKSTASSLNQSKLDVSQMITTATNMATVVSVSPTAVSTSLLTTVQQNIAQGTQTSLTSLSQSLDAGTQAKVTGKETQIKEQIATKAANKPPQAEKASLSVAADHPLTASFVASDADLDHLTYLIHKQPDHGVVTISNPSSSTFTYQPTTYFYGEDSFLFRVNDGTVDSNVAKITITVTPPNNVPVVVTPIPAQSWSGNGSGSYQIPAGFFTDPTGKGLTYSAKLSDGASLPAWLHFDPATQTFTGNPPAGVTSLSIQVTATNGSGVVNQTLTVDFNGPTNDLPTVATPIPDQSWTGSGTGTFKIPAGTFADPDGDPLTFTATMEDGKSLPAWILFDPATQTFSGNPPAGVTKLALKVTASDGQGGVSNSTFNLTFSGATNDLPTVATPISAQTWTGSGSGSFQVPVGAFVDPDGDPLTFTATREDGTALPSWLAFDPATRTFSGNPPSGVTSLSIKVMASDGNGAPISQVFPLSFSGTTNDVPAAATPISAQTWTGSGSGSFQVPAGAFVDPDGDPLTFTATREDGTALPSWLAFDPATRTFSGNPPSGVTSLSIKVMASDGNGAPISQVFPWSFGGTTNDVPTAATPIPAQTWTGSGSGAFQIPTAAFVDPDGDPLSFTATLGNGAELPTWLTFDPNNRTFTGNPPAGVTTLSIKVTASDGHGDSIHQTFALNFSGATNDVPTAATPISAQTWTGSGAGSFQVPTGAFVDPDGDPLSFTATLGNGAELPTWLTFDLTNRSVTGNPPAGVTTLSLKVTASDGHGDSIHQTFSLNFSGSTNDAPTVSTVIPAQTWTGSGAGSFQVPTGAFVDLDGDPLSFTSTLGNGAELPTWLTFNPTTRTFSGNPPTGVTTLALKVTATDGNGGTVNNAFTLNFDNINDPPVANAATLNTDQEKAVSGILTGLDPDGDALSYVIANNGAKGGAVITNATTGAFTYTPNVGATGTDTFTFTVTDGALVSAPATVTVTIRATPTVAFGNAGQRMLDGNVAKVEILLSSVTDRDVTVPCAMAGTATVNVDYSMVSGGCPVTIVAGATSALLSIALLDNTDTEADETLILTLGTPTNARSGAILTHTVTIVSAPAPGGGRDSGDVATTKPVANPGTTQTVSENATVNLNAGGSSGATLYSWSQIAGPPVTLTGADTQTPTFTTPALTAPATLTFRLLVVDSQGQSNGHDVNVTVGLTPRTLTLDDASMTEEASGQKMLAFLVTLSAPLAQTVQVDYATSDGSAKAGQDYTATQGTLTFTAGETTKTILVPVSGDTLDEGNDTFVVTLSNPLNATLAKGVGVSTIIDDDAGKIGIYDRAIEGVNTYE